MDVFEQILSDAQEFNSEIRYHEVVKQWEVVPQGDCNLHCIGSLEDREELERRLRRNPDWSEFRMGKLGPRTNELQLAPGSSIGSRHVILEEYREVVEIYAPGEGASPLVGPCIVASARFVEGHPEHAMHSMPSSVYQVIYQIDFAANVLARLAD